MKAPTTERGGSNRNTEVNSHADWFYGGGEAYWPDLATALANIPQGKRAGQTFAVFNGALIVEYWWNNPLDLTDTGVQLK